MNPVTRRRFGALLLLALIAAPAPRRAAPAPSGELVVFAAASLKEVFEGLTKTFEAAHPGVHVTLQLAGSQELRTQIENGARADVFASADLRHMEALRVAKLVGEPSTFARNEPVLIVPEANPAGLTRFEDLPRAKKLIVGVDEVPIGQYTRQILAKAAGRLGEAFVQSVEANVASRELNVRQIVAKVGLGEGDAGVVYRTDAVAAGAKVRVIDVPAALNVVAEYPIATATAAPHPEAARAWVELVLSDAGRAALSAAGFTLPTRAAR